MRRQLLQTTVYTVGLVGLVVAVAKAVDEANGQVLPGIGETMIAGCLLLVSVLLAGRAWVSLFEDLVEVRDLRRRLAGTYYASQLTKYLPVGGIMQAASQVALTAATGTPLARVGVAYAVFALCSVAAGITLSFGLVFAEALPGWARILALGGLFGPIILHRGLMARLLEIAHRLIARVPDPDQLPDQRRVLACYGWALGNLLTYAASFTVLLGSLTEIDVVPTMSAYALSWVVGFLVVPVPAGIGIREAGLIAAVPAISAAPLLAASLAHRLVSIGAEVAAVVGNGLHRRHRSS